MAEDMEPSEFYWDHIVFKVEDRLFCVPRFGFVKSSEAFATMFLLPPGPEAKAEGQDREHPIVLEGYKKDEFSSLLKVMYPTAESLISGTKFSLGLSKEEWMSVVKLSTIWDMEKIRKYAIHKLSTDFALSPVEKIHLGRRYKIAAWVEGGVIGLVHGDQKPSLDDLATLGWETAARILWIRDNTPSNTLNFRRDDIKCGYCSSSSSLIDFEHNCSSCQQIVAADAELTATGPGTISGPTDRIVQLKAIKGHLNCRGAIFSSSTSFSCPSCSKSYSGPKIQKMNVRITPKITPKTGLNEMIKQAFGEDIM